MTDTLIKTIAADTTEEPQRGIIARTVGAYGFLPGIFRVLLVDPEVTMSAGAVYHHLHLRPDSPFTRVQREMVATVVNGLVGGAP